MRLTRGNGGWEVQEAGMVLMHDARRERAEMWMICHEDDRTEDFDPIERSMAIVDSRMAMGEIDVFEALWRVQGRLLKAAHSA